MRIESLPVVDKVNALREIIFGKTIPDKDKVLLMNEEIGSARRYISHQGERLKLANLLPSGTKEERAYKDIVQASTYSHIRYMNRELKLLKNICKKAPQWRK